MPNDNQNLGNMNIITGVPQRVGAPVSDIVKVNSELTQRYWTNQQQNTQITTALKNMPTIVDEVDKPKIAAASDRVNKAFKQTIDSGNWEDATQTVLNVSKDIANDEALKSIQTNYALIQKSNADLEKRFEKEPALREYADYFKARTLNEYKAKGGSVDADGKSQQINIYAPKTNMDLTEDIKRVDNTVSKMKAIKQATFGNQQHISQADVDKLTDPDVKSVFTNMLKSEDKISTESLTESRLREAAMKELDANPNTKMKMLEIAEANHYKTTGSANVSTQDVQGFLQSKGSTYERQLSLNLSTDYVNAVNKLKETSKTPQQYAAGLKTLNANDNLYKQGQQKLLSLNGSNLSNIYYNLVTGDMTQKVISTVDKYAYRYIDMDRHYFDNKLTDALIKQAQDKSIAPTLNGIESGSFGVNVDMLNPNSKDNQTYQLLQAQYDALIDNKKPIPHDLQVKLNAANAVRNGTIQTLLATYDNLDSTDKESVHSGAWHIIDPLSTIAFAKHSPYSAMGFYNTDANLKDGMTRTYDQSSSQISSHILKNVNPRDLLSMSNEQIVSKYLDKNSAESFTNPTVRTSVISNIERMRKNLGESILSSTAGTSKYITPITALETVGNMTPTAQLTRQTVIKSFFAGGLTDMKSGSIINPSGDDYKNLGYADLKGKELTQEDLNNMSHANVQPLITNGAYVGNGMPFRVTLPIMIEDPAHKGSGKMIPSGNFKNVDVLYNGNPALVHSMLLDEANKLTKSFRANSPSFNDGITTANAIVNSIGSQMQTSDNRYLYNEINNLKARPINGANYNYDLPGATLHVEGKDNQYHVTISSGKGDFVFDTSAPNDIITAVGLQLTKDNGLNPLVEQVVAKSLINKNK